MTDYQGYLGGWSGAESGCTHKDLKEVMRIGKATLWAGGERDVPSGVDWALEICLLGHSRGGFTPPVRLNKEAAHILPPSLSTFAPVPMMTVDWSDGGVPGMGKVWWREMYSAIGKLEGDVVVYCMGGHGRTGTFLAIMAALAGKKYKGCPVLWVRKNYCDKAVETSSQIEYVEQMTGVKVKALSSFRVNQEKNAAAEAARKAAAGSAVTVVGGPPSVSSSAEVGSSYVWDNASNSLKKVEKGHLFEDDQDWDGEWHRRAYGG